MRPLLLVIDAQRDFLSHPGLRPHRSALEASIRDAITHCRAQDILIAHAQLEWDPQHDERMPHWQSRDIQLCKTGSVGASPPIGLGPIGDEARFIKTGFSAFAGTDLAAWLRNKNVDTIWLAGVHTHTCVRHTALDAHQLGFQVRICADAVGSYEPFEAASSLIYLERRGISHLPHDAISADRASTSTRSHEDGVASALGKVSVTGFDERTNALRGLAQLLVQRRDLYATTICKEVSKPIRMAEGEVQRAIELIEFNLKQLVDIARDTYNPEGICRRQPRGRVAVMTPWNNPLAIPMGQLAPALLLGNAVIWKPSPLAARTSELLWQDLETCGLTHSAIALVKGDSAVSRCLAASPDLDALTFTGSCEAAWMIAAACRPQGTELQAEMGGNNAAILWPEIPDPITLAGEVVYAAFGFSGQRCTALRRVIVPADQLEFWWQHLSEATSKLSWTDPDSPTCELGPMISESKADALRALLCRSQGELARHSQPHPDSHKRSGAWFPPTLVICEFPDSEIIREESFGPILVVQPAHNFDHAMQLLNGVAQGLTASLVGGNPEHVARFQNEAQAGIIKLNRVDAGAGISLPFGGRKASGWGPPQHGKSNLEFFTKLQAIYTA